MNNRSQEPRVCEIIRHGAYTKDSVGSKLDYEKNEIGTKGKKDERRER